MTSVPGISPKTEIFSTKTQPHVLFTEAKFRYRRFQSCIDYFPTPVSSLCSQNIMFHLITQIFHEEQTKFRECLLPFLQNLFSSHTLI